jgi:hypothetical protein
MTIPTFQKHDRVAFRESPEVEGKIVEWWKRGFYKVARDHVPGQDHYRQ